MPAAALKFDELLYDSLESLSLPDVYLRLREVMESDNGSMADAAEVISLDPALAARILRMANSAFYGFRSEVDTITRAANILGMQKIHDLVLAASVSQAFEGMSNELMDIGTFWYRSVHCGFLAQAIADSTAGLRGKAVFTSTLGGLDTIAVPGLYTLKGYQNIFSPESRRLIAHFAAGLDESRLHAVRDLLVEHQNAHIRCLPVEHAVERSVLVAPVLAARRILGVARDAVQLERLAVDVGHVPGGIEDECHRGVGEGRHVGHVRRGRRLGAHVPFDIAAGDVQVAHVACPDAPQPHPPSSSPAAFVPLVSLASISILRVASA